MVTYLLIYLVGVLAVAFLLGLIAGAGGPDSEPDFLTMATIGWPVMVWFFMGAGFGALLGLIGKRKVKS